MNISDFKEELSMIKRLDAISVQLLRVNKSKECTDYYTHEIKINPESELNEYIEKISDKYTTDQIYESIREIEEYKGDFVKGNIYRLPISDELIQDNYNKLNSVVVNPNVEGGSFKGDWNALLINGTICNIEGLKHIMMVSMKSPVTLLKNKFMVNKGNFKKITAPVLTLNMSLDAIIMDGNFYMLTMQAENLFNMERSYKIRCNAKVDAIIDSVALSNNDTFRKIANKGFNPRRFLSFNEKRLEVLSDKTKLEKYMQMFNIRLINNTNIDTETEESVERLIKFLCDKAMLDPVDNDPREVSAARKWS